MPHTDGPKKSDANRGISKQKAVGVNPRVAFGFLLFLSFITLLLGVWQIGRAINKPFDLAGERSLSEIEAEHGAPSGSALIDDAHNKDTDGDGISDADELELYGTSPYLADTDSDGFSDSQELANGHDPLCPAGADCRGVGVSSGSLDTDEDNLAVFEPTSPVQLDNETKQQLSTITAPELRQMLLDSGQIDAATLNQIDDQTLMQAYQELLQSSL